MWKVDKEDLLDRFLKYVQIDTESDSNSTTCPSSEKQWDLIYFLERELKELGLKDVKVTEFGYVLATIPSNSKKQDAKQIAFLAHVDTASGCSGRAKPLVHRNYLGDPIVLPDDPSKMLIIDEIPLLKEKIGEDIITASGTTLLGADDKAGVAIIMSMVNHLIHHPEIVHGPIRICFNPDEEIGRGMDKISLEEIGAVAAYTLDSEHLGEIDFETFSADQAIIEIEGVAAHPGSAKGVLINALRVAANVIENLPNNIFPEEVDGREGFIHPVELSGTPERAKMVFILRDFELDGLEKKKEILEKIVKNLKAKATLRVKPQYRNMRYWLEKDLTPVEYAKEAIKRAGLKPHSEAIRGGTDGSRLTERGLPTPNIFTGFHNIHSEKEWISLQDMTASVTTLLHLVQIWEENS